MFIAYFQRMKIKPSPKNRVILNFGKLLNLTAHLGYFLLPKVTNLVFHSLVHWPRVISFVNKYKLPRYLEGRGHVSYISIEKNRPPQKYCFPKKMLEGRVISIRAIK